MAGMPQRENAQPLPFSLAAVPHAQVNTASAATIFRGVNMKTVQKISIAIILLTFLAAIYAYPLLPEKVASHWDANGNANGYMGRGFGAFFMPVLGILLFGLFYALPLLDPMKKNYSAFRADYDNFTALMIAFMAYVYALTLASNLGYSFNLVQFLAPAFAALIYYVGVLIGKTKRNWFVGVRTPWALSSEKVWDRTNAIAGKMFKAAGIVALVGIVMPMAGLFASVAVIFATAVFAVVYSYLEFQKEARAGMKGERKKR